MLFYEGKSMGRSNLNIGKDVESIALREFGRFGGFLLQASNINHVMHAD